MLKVFKNFVALGLAFAILLTGCGLISVTFLLDEEIESMYTTWDWFPYTIDVTDEEDWEDHKDDIQQVNWVSFELYLSNYEESEITVNGYVDDIDNPECTSSSCAEGTTRILKDIKIPATSSIHITMGESFAYQENTQTLKDYAERGAFHFYAVSDGNAFSVDSGRVVVAIVAGL